MPYLTQDIIGSSSRIAYGRKGDEVRIYSDHDNVFIVERHDGLRFSLRKEHLSEQKIYTDVDKSNDVKTKKKK